MDTPGFEDHSSHSSILEDFASRRSDDIVVFFVPGSRRTQILREVFALLQKTKSTIYLVFSTSDLVKQHSEMKHYKRNKHFTEEASPSQSARDNKCYLTCYLSPSAKYQYVLSECWKHGEHFSDEPEIDPHAPLPLESSSATFDHVYFCQCAYSLFLYVVCTDLARLVHHLCLLMLMAGDIETNPGPTGKYCMYITM